MDLLYIVFVHKVAKESMRLIQGLMFKMSNNACCVLVMYSDCFFWCCKQLYIQKGLIRLFWYRSRIINNERMFYFLKIRYNHTIVFWLLCFSTFADVISHFKTVLVSCKNERYIMDMRFLVIQSWSSFIFFFYMKSIVRLHLWSISCHVQHDSQMPTGKSHRNIY